MFQSELIHVIILIEIKLNCVQQNTLVCCKLFNSNILLQP